MARRDPEVAVAIGLERLKFQCAALHCPLLREMEGSSDGYPSNGNTVDSGSTVADLTSYN